MKASPAPSPATPEEAERLARKVVGDYLTGCSMYGYQPEALGNYLQVLTTLAGMLMARAEGSHKAVGRMQSAAEFVSSVMPPTADGPKHWPSYDPTTPTKFELHLDTTPPRPVSAPVVLSTPPRPEPATQLPDHGKLLVVGDLFARVARGG